MADEAFALSPISARPALPGEADYEAIREAFMETSRGRWFLGEYAKRNRNADTAMVLDAVARIEDALATQRQEQSRDNELAEALTALGRAVDQAREAAATAVASLRLEEHLAPIHKGARIIKEISWRWREIGADSRICDMIDSQLAAIEASCTRIAETDVAAAVSTSFDIIKCKLDDLGRSEDTSRKMTEAATPAAAPPAEQVAAAEPEPVAAESSAETAFVAKTPAETRDSEAVIAEPERLTETAELEAPAEIAAAQPEAPEHNLEAAADAHDEAVLEMVAIEMAAPDPMDDFPPDPIVESHAVQTTLPPVVESVVAGAPQPASPPPQTMSSSSPQAVQQSPAEPSPPVVPEPSLGTTIIANGILQRPKPASDPLAPIRRMSQAEKIAFFS